MAGCPGLAGRSRSSRWRSTRGPRATGLRLATFYRAKGLEFAHALIPDRDRYPRSRFAHESDDAYRERTELERRVLFVAMTRARDGLWLGTGPGSR